MQDTKHCGRFCLLFTGIFLICFGSIVLIFFESIYDSFINHNLKFAPGTPAYENWAKTPRVQTDIYFFNWTNADQNKNHSIKPEFEEIGPYRFYEIRSKENITWHDDYVNYVTTTTTFFDQKNSPRNLSDVITTLNVVAVGITYVSRFQSFWTKKMISFGLSSKISDVYITKSAAELLFDGYDDPILGLLSKIPLISAVPEKGGMFFGRNGTPGLDGTYSMHFKNDHQFGSILLWNGKNQSDFFSGHCNNVKGTAGEFLPLNRQRDQILLYSSDLCKTLALKYVEDVVVKGVKGYKYSAEYGFDNGTVYPENSCYCTGECIPTGVFNVSSCRMGSPTFLSFPHFFNADPVYRESVKGMKPNKTLHEFYMIVEPKTGIIMEVQGGMQVNMLLQPISSIRLYEKVPKVYVPIFHINHIAHLSDEVAEGLWLLQNLPEYSSYFLYSVILLGCISFLGALVCLVNFKKSNVLANKKVTPIPQYEQVPLSEKKPGIVWKFK